MSSSALVLKLKQVSCLLFIEVQTNVCGGPFVKSIQSKPTVSLNNLRPDTRIRIL